MSKANRLVLAYLAFAAFATQVAASTLTIPTIESGEKRRVTVEDIAAVREIGSVSVSPDGERYAIFLRQADSKENRYRTGWFVGNVRGGPVARVGDGGEIHYDKRFNGFLSGHREAMTARWSPDGKWIAYRLRKNGVLQLWRSRTTGGAVEQLSVGDRDVLDFSWSSDGHVVYYSAGLSRAASQRLEEQRYREGYRYDEDMMHILDLHMPEREVPPRNPEIWVLEPRSRAAHLASEHEQAAFAQARARDESGIEKPGAYLRDAAVAPVTGPKGAIVWLSRTHQNSLNLKVVMSTSPDGSNPRECAASECVGRIERVWWNADGEQVFFHLYKGSDASQGSFYAWSPASGAVRMVLHAPDDNLRDCAPAANDLLICARETKLRPDHLAAIDMKSGEIRVLADVNPEFNSIRLGQVERIEWETPTFAWNQPGAPLENLYPRTAHGYIIYPPDFDPFKRYPVFIEPYNSAGFNASVGGEHALHAYAANDIIVLNTGFPTANAEAIVELGRKLMMQLFAQELDFPHMAMYSESTLRALDLLLTRGFVDEKRVGIGGVSNGTTIPLHIMKQYDRISAISISGPGWGAEEYYIGTALNEAAVRSTFGSIGYEDWKPKPDGAGRLFWEKLDASFDVERTEAPILMNLAAAEVDGRLVRLTRHLRQADLPYDAYIFRDELHIKWQPAHLYHVMVRNLDWFRFWLLDVEDSAPEKAEQYARWRELRTKQCRNPRSLRDYCNSEGNGRALEPQSRSDAALDAGSGRCGLPAGPVGDLQQSEVLE